jgi:hypothetical protein
VLFNELCRNDRYRNRHVLQLLLTALGRHDDLTERFRTGGAGRRSLREGGTGEQARFASDQ